MMRSSGKNYILYVMGARGSRPVHGRDYEVFGGQTTCFIVKGGRHAVVIDCGTGLYDAEPILSDCDIIDVIFTHFHYDHILGMLDTSVFPQGVRLSFFGSFSANKATDVLTDFYRAPFWPITPALGAMCDVSNEGASYNLGDGFSFSAYQANHPNGSNIILLHVMGKKVCFMFDTEINGLPDIAGLKGCDFLIFDGMFDDLDYNEHIGWGHSTYQQGCRIALTNGCKELLITHHNPKSTDKMLLAYEENAKKLFPCTRFCRAGDLFSLETGESEDDATKYRKIALVR